MVEGERQLEPAAADPGVVLALDGERRVDGQAEARLIDPPGAALDLTRHDEGLGPGAAVGEPALHQELVGAGFGRLGHGPQCSAIDGRNQTSRDPSPGAGQAEGQQDRLTDL